MKRVTIEIKDAHYKALERYTRTKKDYTSDERVRDIIDDVLKSHIADGKRDGERYDSSRISIALKYCYVKLVQ